jgi:hypothetical protein
MMDDPPVDARSPKMISARFGRVQPESADKRQRFAIIGPHLKYLAGADREGEFDFYRIAAGPQSLAERYEGRKNAAKAKMLV